MIINQQKYKGSKVYAYIYMREGKDEKYTFTARHGRSPKCTSQCLSSSP